MKPQPRYQPGDRIGGRYQVHQALMGGMGEVYLCLDLETIHPYALKTFQQRYQTGTQRLHQAFEKEVATWVALEKHPNIVRCFYMDTLDNQPFMVLEWIAGEEGKETDLRGWLRRGPLDLRLALDITIDICRGLIHAQEKQPGLVHCDLKPENILIAQGRLAKITDFGLVEIAQEADLELDATTDAIETGRRQSIVGRRGIVGTPAYMAPEQWRGENLDERTDIYAVGCVLYEMLTGHPPFRASTFDGFHRQHLKAVIPKLEGGQHWARSIDTLLTRCLAKAQTERFVTASDLLRQLALIYEQRFKELPKVVSISGEFTAEDYSNRGSTYANLHQYDKALEDLTYAIELNPEFGPAYYNRGGVYYHLQRYVEALSDMTRSISVDPADAATAENRGVIYERMGRNDEALDDFNRAIELTPFSGQVFYNRGRIYRKLQHNQQALADFTRAIELEPTYVQPYITRGELYSEMQDFRRALADFNVVIELGATDAQDYINRGSVHAILRNFDKALDDFQSALQLNPQNARARMGMLMALGALELDHNAQSPINEGMS